MNSTVRRWVFLTLATMVAIVPSAGQPQCRLCAPQHDAVKVEATRPITVEVETALDFSRAAGTGSGGSIAVDERSGARRVVGLADVGGIAIRGTVRLTGSPMRHVHVSLPGSVRLQAPDGSVADAVDLRTDLPPDPVLDAAGVLNFAFGGRLVVSGGNAGDFRGRITITADYQ